MTIPSVLRRASRSGPEWGRWWSPFLAGAAAGILASLLLRRTRTLDGDRPAGERVAGGAGEGGWERWRDAWGEVVEGASEGLAGARGLLAGRGPGVDMEALEAAVAEMPCASACRMRLLGEGIVEVVGSCPSDEDARTVLDRIAREPGVEVVVNRVWTPGSAGNEDLT